MSWIVALMAVNLVYITIEIATALVLYLVWKPHTQSSLYPQVCLVVSHSWLDIWVIEAIWTGLKHYDTISQWSMICCHNYPVCVITYTHHSDKLFHCFKNKFCNVGKLCQDIHWFRWHHLFYVKLEASAQSTYIYIYIHSHMYVYVCIYSCMCR